MIHDLFLLYTFLGPGQPCGALLKEDSGWFGPSDSDNSGVYDNHLTCWWILLADPQKDILFTITDVDIPSGGGTACSGDSLYVRLSNSKFSTNKI